MSSAGRHPGTDRDALSGLPGATTAGPAAAFVLWRRHARERCGQRWQFESVLADARSLDRAAALLGRLEPLAPSAFGFECPLGEGPPLADFGVTLHRLGEPAVTPQPWPRGSSEDLPEDAYAALAEWRRGAGAPDWQAVARVLLEFDTGSDPGDATLPSVFLRLEPWGERDRRLPDVAALLADLGCAMLHDDATDLRRRLTMLADEGPCLHVGAMLARPGAPVRVVSPDLSPGRASRLLARLPYRHCRDEADALLAEVSRLDPSVAVRVNVDVGTTTHERVGIDVTFPGRRKAGAHPHDSSWSRLIEHLLDDGLCTPAKAATVLAWRGTQRLIADPWDASDQGVILSQSISHVKIDLTPERRPRAKVYLVCSFSA